MVREQECHQERPLILVVCPRTSSRVLRCAIKVLLASNLSMPETVGLVSNLKNNWRMVQENCGHWLVIGDQISVHVGIRRFRSCLFIIRPLRRWHDELKSCLW